MLTKNINISLQNLISLVCLLIYARTPAPGWVKLNTGMHKAAF